MEHSAFVADENASWLISHATRNTSGEKQTRYTFRRDATSVDFNPRSPCGERPSPCAWTLAGTRFNPRPPCGERLGGMREECEAQGFNPRPPMWGTTGTAFQLLTHDAVSTHASHVGSDKRIKWGGWDQNRFQPTLPVWGATGRSWTGKPVEVVSTHAPRVGSDDSRRVHQRCRECFNPRSPCGERRRPWTSPASPTGFNPRPPCEERLDGRVAQRLELVSIHAPHTGSDYDHVLDVHVGPVSIHAPPCGERPCSTCTVAVPLSFQSALPMWGAMQLLGHAL